MFPKNRDRFMKVPGSLRVFKNGTVCANRRKIQLKKRIEKRKTAAEILLSAAVLIGKFGSDPRLSDSPGLRHFIL